MAWGRHGRLAHPLDHAELLKPLRPQHVLNQIVPRLVDVRIDLVYDEALPAECESDVAADLSNPYGLPRKAQRGEPDPQMVALAGRLPRLLKRKVLTTLEKIDAADGRIWVLAPEEVGPESLEGRAPVEDLRDVPARLRKAGKHLADAADQDEVQGILYPLAIGRGRAARHCLEGPPQSRFVNGANLVRGISRLARRRVLIVSTKTRKLHQEEERHEARAAD